MWVRLWCPPDHRDRRRQIRWSERVLRCGWRIRPRGSSGTGGGCRHPWSPCRRIDRLSHLGSRRLRRGVTRRGRRGWRLRCGSRCPGHGNDGRGRRLRVMYRWCGRSRCRGMLLRLRGRRHGCAGDALSRSPGCGGHARRWWRDTPRWCRGHGCGMRWVDVGARGDGYGRRLRTCDLMRARDGLLRRRACDRSGLGGGSVRRRRCGCGCHRAFGDGGRLRGRGRCQVADRRGRRLWCGGDRGGCGNRRGRCRCRCGGGVWLADGGWRRWCQVVDGRGRRLCGGDRGGCGNRRGRCRCRCGGGVWLADGGRRRRCQLIDRCGRRLRCGCGRRGIRCDRWRWLRRGRGLLGDGGRLGRCRVCGCGFPVGLDGGDWDGDSRLRRGGLVSGRCDRREGDGGCDLFGGCGRRLGGDEDERLEDEGVILDRRPWRR